MSDTLEFEDGQTDLARLMSKKADDLTSTDINEICKILRDRRNHYALEEAKAKAGKAAKPKALPKSRKPKTEADAAAMDVAKDLGDDELSDLLGDL